MEKFILSKIHILFNEFTDLYYYVDAAVDNEMSINSLLKFTFTLTPSEPE